MKYDETTNYNELSTVGERLTYLRKYYGYSQKDISIILDVTQGTVSKYEVGTRPIPTEVIDKLAVMYKVPAEFIEQGIEKPNVEEFQWISPEDIVQLSNFVNSLKYLKKKL